MWNFKNSQKALLCEVIHSANLIKAFFNNVTVCKEIPIGFLYFLKIKTHANTVFLQKCHLLDYGSVCSIYLLITYRHPGREVMLFLFLSGNPLPFCTCVRRTMKTTGHGLKDIWKILWFLHSWKCTCAPNSYMSFFCKAPHIVPLLLLLDYKFHESRDQSYFATSPITRCLTRRPSVNICQYVLSFHNQKINFQFLEL